jgi:SAM-dependent methyltransferase
MSSDHSRQQPVPRSGQPSEIAAGLNPSEGRDLYGQDPAAYQVGRPEYPERVWEVLETRCNLRAGSRVVEIGPGTGLVTRRLLSTGAEVTGIEPNPAMAAYLQQTLDHNSMRVVIAPFEHAHLAENAFDLAVAATSFHWVDQRVGTEKLRRVVRPGGWVSLWWMLFEDPTRPDDFTKEAETLLGGSPSSILEPGNTPFQLDEIARRSDLQRAGFIDVDSELIHSEADMDASRLRALYATMAIILRRPPSEQTRALDALEALVTEEYGGRVKRSFVTALYTARNP